MVWPFGWSVTSTAPGDLIDWAGRRIAGSGDRLDVEAGFSSSPGIDLVVCRVLRVNGLEVPDAPFPSSLPHPTLPPDAPSGLDVSVCGTDGDGTDGRQRVPTFTIEFQPTDAPDETVGPFLMIDAGCTFQRFALSPGAYLTMVRANGWHPAVWDDVVVRGSFGEVLIDVRAGWLPMDPTMDPAPPETFRPPVRIA